METPGIEVGDHVEGAKEDGANEVGLSSNGHRSVSRESAGHLDDEEFEIRRARGSRSRNENPNPIASIHAAGLHPSNDGRPLAP